MKKSRIESEESMSHQENMNNENRFHEGLSLNIHTFEIKAYGCKRFKGISFNLEAIEVDNLRENKIFFDCHKLTLYFHE